MIDHQLKSVSIVVTATPARLWGLLAVVLRRMTYPFTHSVIGARLRAGPGAVRAEAAVMPSEDALGVAAQATPPDG
jgi:hypothetical protein